MLVPQTLNSTKTMKVTINVDGTDKAPIVMNFPVVNTEWVGSHAYTYTITLYLDSVLGIDAKIDSVTIGAWQDDAFDIDNKPAA